MESLRSPLQTPARRVERMETPRSSFTLTTLTGDGATARRYWPGTADWTIIDESFCDTDPELSHAELASREGIVVLKGIGKF